jgi:hypothetical protein
MHPHSLRTRGHENPLNLGPGPIELSWAAEPEGGTWKIQASRKEDFDIDHLVWESPWHSSGTAQYEGPHPNARERIYWRVGTKNGEQTAWSETAFFEAADPSDWRADWILGPVMRHEFEIPGVPTWARLSILAQDDVVLIINGEVLAILKSPNVNVFDVTPLLAEGNNEIIVETGRWVSFQIDGRLDTTLDFGTHTDLDWLHEGGESRPVSVSDLNLA